MSLAPGARLEHYEVLGPLGVGGMGEVYRAQDTRLRREVAIKVLPHPFAQNPDRLTRFEREAQVLAALNHPNIAAIYGIEHSDGIRFLVLELVEGPTLAERIALGAIPLEESLSVGKQIAEALGAAHDKGIVHRDLKPANVKVKPDGTVKVLDFGLAAVVQPQMSESTDPANSPTLTMGATQAGVIMGTAGYMCPEQARGSNVDKRADIWGFGVVLYEMVTGRRLFQGDTVSDTLAAVLKEQPDLDRVPLKVRRLIRKCLEKDPKKRLRDIGDAWDLLDDQPLAASVAAKRGPGWLWPSVAAIAILALAALAIIHFSEKPLVGELSRFEIPAPPGVTLGNNSDPVLSPDGRKIAFLATRANGHPLIWIRSLDSEEARPLAGTEDAGNTLIWSPDSRNLAFVSGGKLKRIDLGGGPALTVGDNPSGGFGGIWTSDNRIIFASLGPVQIVSASGGPPTRLTVLDGSRNELAHTATALLPDGRHFLYARLSVPLENGGIYIGSLDLKPEQQSLKKLLADTSPVAYVASPHTGDQPGWLLFVRGITLRSEDSGGTLMAQPFDGKKMELAGEARPIAEHVRSFFASPNGVLTFATAGSSGNSRLTSVDRKGSVLSTAGDIGEYRELALSPDGARAAYVRGIDLWLFEFGRGFATKFTVGNPSQNPSWSADGSSLTFNSIRSTGWGIYRKASNQSGQEDLLYQSPDPKGVPNWTRDGKFLMFDAFASDGKLGDLWLLPAGEHTPSAFLRTDASEFEGRFSPDAHWVAYASDRSGKFEIYVLPFDESNPGPAPGGLRQISTEGGTDPHWRADGKEIFYMALDGYVMSVAVNEVGGALQPGAPQRLFKSPAAAFGTWDVFPGGKKFLITAPENASGAPAAQPFHVVMNWPEILKH